MKSEYVRLSHSEKFNGQKEMLQSELELLDIVQSMRNYKKLRTEEMALKVSLKSKINEAIEAVKKLEGYFPKTNYKIPKGSKITETIKKDLSLQEEIEAIREKLQRLREGV